MTEISRRLVKGALEYAELEAEEALREGYSGRGMYGKTTWGIVGTLEEFLLFLVELAKIEGTGGDSAQEIAQRVSQDRMSRLTIFYFPGLKLVDDEDDYDGS
jgi:hypothetical protein